MIRSSLLLLVAFAGFCRAETPLTEAQRRDLLSIAPKAGTVIRLPTFDLQSPDADWQFQPAARFVYADADEMNPAHWRFDRETPGELGRGLWSRETFDLKPNRRYTVSALVRADFARANSEINCVLMWCDADGKELPGRRPIGFPAKTAGPNGWQRFEAEFVSPSYDDLGKGRFGFWFFLGKSSETPLDFRIADIALIEQPPLKQATASDPLGEVTFPGGPGRLPMRVESAEPRDGGGFRVRVTGMDWTIDPTKREIVAHQRIETTRELARFAFDLPMENLQLIRQDETVAVLANDSVAIGIQCDGMVAISPQRPTRMITTSELDGGFIRYGDGNLFASDGRGGFTVNPLPGLGSGVVSKSEPLTQDLDFVRFERGDLQSLSTAAPGWQIAWDLDVGERVFLSAFPPREYHWAQSFEDTWMLTSRDWNPAEDYTSPYWSNVSVWLLWDFHQREWGMSFGEKYLPHDAAQIREHIAAIHDLGKRALFYTSAWFFGSRDPLTYAGAVMEQIDEFEFDGFYTDGLPAIDWLAGYIEMRLLRERLDARDRPGLIYVHDSVPQSGRHPAAWMPWLYTYADVHYMAEGVESTAGAEWNWVRYVIGGYRSTNAIGAIKGDAWTGPEFHNEIDKYLAALLWNARIGEAGHRGHNDVYVPIREKLEKLWREHGSDAEFYEQHYLPAARKLISRPPEVTELDAE